MFVFAFALMKFYWYDLAIFRPYCLLEAGQLYVDERDAKKHISFTPLEIFHLHNIGAIPIPCLKNLEKNFCYSFATT